MCPPPFGDIHDLITRSSPVFASRTLQLLLHDYLFYACFTVLGHKTQFNTPPVLVPAPPRPLTAVCNLLHFYAIIFVITGLGISFSIVGREFRV